MRSSCEPKRGTDVHIERQAKRVEDQMQAQGTHTRDTHTHTHTHTRAHATNHKKRSATKSGRVSCLQSGIINGGLLFGLLGFWVCHNEHTRHNTIHYYGQWVKFDPGKVHFGNEKGSKHQNKNRRAPCAVFSMEITLLHTLLEPTPRRRRT